MTETVQENNLKVIIFELMDKEYAIEVDVVQSIEKDIVITRVPKTPFFVKGVTNLRGVVTPIVDLRERFGLELKEVDDSTRVIIVSLPEYDVGLIVDGANDVMDIPNDAIGPQPDVVGSVQSDFIAGVAKVESRLFVMLDLQKVLEPVKRGAAE